MLEEKRINRNPYFNIYICIYITLMGAKISPKLGLELEHVSPVYRYRETQSKFSEIEISILPPLVTSYQPHSKFYSHYFQNAKVYLQKESSIHYH
jgi:hypothetical protein